jgi:hypothetical protein
LQQVPADFVHWLVPVPGPADQVAQEIPPPPGSSPGSQRRCPAVRLPTRSRGEHRFGVHERVSEAAGGHAGEVTHKTTWKATKSRPTRRWVIVQGCPISEERHLRSRACPSRSVTISGLGDKTLGTPRGGTSRACGEGARLTEFKPDPLI